MPSQRSTPSPEPEGAQILIVLRIVAIVSLLLCRLGAAKELPQVGPPNGSLVIHGGGGSEAVAPGGGVDHLEAFVELAGGENAVVVVIPTAVGRENYDAVFAENYFKPFRKLGVSDIRLLHARNRTEADSDVFVEPIDRATGVWLTGGRHWRLADTYLGTKTYRALWDLLGRGGVIAGGSAGATIQGEYLVRGDTRGPELVMGDHERGFAFLKKTAIDQHLLERNRQFDLFEVIRARPELLGIGLDSNAAIVVQKDEFRVIGKGYVAIYDPKSIGADGRFYLLGPGDRFDLATRTPKDAKGNEIWMPHLYRVLTLDQATLQRYAGQYEAAEGTIEISVDGSTLIAFLSGADRRELVAVGNHTFYDRTDGAKVKFEIDSEGTVARFQWHRPAILNQQEKRLIRAEKQSAAIERETPKP